MNLIGIRWSTATLLFACTALTIFWAGASSWMPVYPFFANPYWMSMMEARQTFLAQWQDGACFAAALLGILLAHEMGHYWMTRLYRVPASPPIFLPMPISPLGTFGAVIAMDGRNANKRQVFDIGLAGPLAGLLIAIPVLWHGVSLPAAHPLLGRNTFSVSHPLLIQWMAELFREGGAATLPALNTELNPWLMAGWTGLLVTGLNMVPIGQLDGGHVTHGIFGRYAIWIARIAVAGAVSYMIFTQQLAFLLMLLLILYIGLRHPPTQNDDVKLGWFRCLLGLLSLSLPLLCIPTQIFKPI